MITHEDWKKLEEKISVSRDNYNLYPPVECWYQEYFLESCAPISRVRDKNSNCYPCAEMEEYPPSVLDGVINIDKDIFDGWRVWYEVL